MDFDQYVRNYDHELGKGLRLSGEGREFFARGRLLAARDHFERTGIKPQHIIELGCGDGTNIRIMRELWPESHLIGLDTSHDSLEVARHRFSGSQVEFTTPSEHMMRGKAQPADWIFLNGVMHHVPVAERSGLLDTIRRLLTRHGILTLFDNNPFNPGTRLVMSRIPFDRDAIMVNPYRLMSQLGRMDFAQISCRFLFVFPRFLSALRFMEPALTRLPLGSQYVVYARRE